ncbi:MAG TPA: metallophosphoesterase, partial [bacterium]|nr:metallophosphoesterase [bacterium]
LINPDVVVVTGDLTDSNGYTDENWPESDQYPPMLNLWNSYEVPTFILPGNHDMSPFHKEDDVLRWNRFFDTSDYSFNAGPYHFTAFDDSFLMIGGKQDEAFREELFPEQLSWIEKDLTENAGAKMRILLYHVPLHNTKSKVKELAAAQSVKLALYGHLHLNQVDKQRGTTYVQTGAAYDGSYRVLELVDGKIGEINAKKDGFSAFKVGALTTEESKSPDGGRVTLKVGNNSIREFPNAAWRVEMPSAPKYDCEGCKVAAVYPNGAKTLVKFTFDIPAKGEATAVLSVK